MRSMGMYHAHTMRMPALRHSADLSRGGRCNPNDGEADGSNTIWKLGRAWIFRKVFVGSSIIFQVEEPTMAEAHNGHEATKLLETYFSTNEIKDALTRMCVRIIFVSHQWLAWAHPDPRD